jgi:hypothetical protein
MNFDEINDSLSDRWFKIYQSSFLILKASDKLKHEIAAATSCGVLDLRDLCKLVCQYSLIDWRGVRNPDDTDLMYSKPVAIEALMSMPTLLQFVLEHTFKD